MKKKKTPIFPRSILKSMVEDIKKLSPGNEGRLFILEMVEEIPFDIRHNVFEGLSAFYEPAMVDFFHLLKMEYGVEVENLCNRALEKYNMAGMDISPPEIFQGTFLKAYASCSRHTGRITLDLAWNTGGNGVHVECFYLTFNSDGIHSFFLVENMPLNQYQHDRRVLTEMEEVGYNEACFLISQAYSFNIRHMSRPALGKFLYQKYLDSNIALSDQQERELLRRISLRLAPRQLVNSFFYALKYHDLKYMFSLISPDKEPETEVEQQFYGFMNVGTILLEGQVEEVYASAHTARVSAYSLGLKEHELERIYYQFHLLKEENSTWYITAIEILENKPAESLAALNPFEARVYCRAYEIIDMDELFSVLDRVDNIREVEELPYGMHMRVTGFEDDFFHGVSFFTGVIADLVINGDEFVLISSEHSTLMDLHALLTSVQQSAVVCRGEYEVNLMTAYSYLGGHYVNFEDVLLDEENELVFEDGMRFLSATYLVKDNAKVLKRIENLDNINIKIYGDYRVYYQLEESCGESSFFAEYVLGPNWVSISTFGEQDMNLARQKFEDTIYDCLEFDGMEVKEDSIFNVLTSEVKREHPGLEKLLKEVYLNKWYNSRLAGLRGMSPSEACQSEEGERLLWSMFKKIRQKAKKKPGRRNNLDIKEYIRIVEQKKGIKH